MNALKPVDPTERIEILDILRGFALLGIIFNNIQYFSGYTFSPFNSLKLSPYFNLNEQIYQILDVIVTAKFYTLFSLLFAVGFYLQFSKYREDTKEFFRIYRRRLFFLLLIGIVHNLIWFGDILFLYAIIGFVLILFRNMSSKNLLRWSIFFLILPFLFDLLFMLFYTGTDPGGMEAVKSAAHSNYPGMIPESVTNTFINGDIFELFSLNIFILKWKWMGYIPSGRLLITLGIFLLGYYLGSIQFFKEKSKTLFFWTGTFFVGFISTLTAYQIGGDIYMFPSTPSNELFKLLLVTGQIFMCLFYIVSIFKILRSGPGRAVLNYLKPVGRMALTNYILQTLICTAIFSNFGLDLICRIEFVYAVIIAVFVLLFQIVFSNIWLKYFRFGPLEWIWRCLTYKKIIKIKVQT